MWYTMNQSHVIQKTAVMWVCGGKTRGLNLRIKATNMELMHVFAPKWQFHYQHEGLINWEKTLQYCYVYVHTHIYMI